MEPHDEIVPSAPGLRLIQGRASRGRSGADPDHRTTLGQLAARLKRRRLNGAEDVGELFGPELERATSSHLLVVALDQQHRVLHVQEVATSAGKEVPVDDRKLFRTLLLQDAAAFFCVHNHVHSDVTPRGTDVSLTRRWKRLGDLHGITLLDHVIVGGGSYYSMMRNGCL